MRSITYGSTYIAQELFETVAIEYNGTKEEYSYLPNGFKELILSRQLPAVYGPIEKEFETRA